MVKLQFRLTTDEFFQYNYYTAWSSPKRKRYRMLYFLRVILLYGAVALLYVLNTNPHYLWIDATVFLSTGILYLLFIPYFIRLSVKRKVNDLLSKKENFHILEDAEVVVSETGILDKDPVSESRYHWEAIVHFAETDSSYYLYTNSYHAIVIPKRAFGDAKEQEETERLLNVYLPLEAI